MTTLNLTGQQDLADDILPQLTAFVQALVERKPIWEKLSPEKRVRWVESDKDPIMALLVGTRMKQLVKAYNEATGETP